MVFVLGHLVGMKSAVFFRQASKSGMSNPTPHHGTCIVKFSAIVRSRKKSHELSSSKEFVSILDDLVGTADQVEIVFLVQKLCHDIFPKGKRDTLVIFTPAINFIVRIGPE
jgi:hypothetical protein